MGRLAKTAVLSFAALGLAVVWLAVTLHSAVMAYEQADI